jgi:hypothetical protein
VDDHVEWESRQMAGWGEYCAARARLTARLAEQALLCRLESARRVPLPEHAESTPRGQPDREAAIWPLPLRPFGR